MAKAGEITVLITMPFWVCVVVRVWIGALLLAEIAFPRFVKVEAKAAPVAGWAARRVRLKVV